MLKELTVKNFKSINEELLFSMEADYDRVSEYPEHIVEINGNKLLKVASMYGPNGGGKSNLLKALVLGCWVAVGGDQLPDNIEAFVNSSNEIIEETYFFVDDKYEIGYNFQINILKSDDFTDNNLPLLRMERARLKIHSETITYKDKNSEDFKVLLVRNDLGEISSELFDLNNDIKDFNISNSKSIVKYIYDTYVRDDKELPLHFDIIKHLYEQFNSIVSINVSMPGIRRYSKDSLEKIEKFKNTIIKLLFNADIRIKDIRISYDEGRGEQFYFVREFMLGEKKCDREISIRNESDGTRKLFYLLINLLSVSRDSKICYCDDLSAYLHPKMTKALIEYFQSNKSRSQFIFNSHDLTNMTNELFRRDEIWLIYKDVNYSTQAMPLSSIVNYKGEQIRKDSKYNKQYLEGRYGADPFIEKGLNWND